MKKAVLFLLVPALAAHADLYRWTDANGQVHFSDKKPGQDKGVQTMDTPKPKPIDGPARPADERSTLERQKRMADILQQENAEREAAEKRAAAEKAEHQRRCNQLKDLKRRTDGRAVYQLDDNGERRFLDEKSRDEFAKGLNQTLSEHCQ